MPMRFGGPHRRPPMRHGGGCNFFFIPGFLFGRVIGLVLFGIVFFGMAIMFLVIAILSSDWFFIAFTAVFLIVAVSLIISSIVKRNKNKRNNNENGNVTSDGQTTFYDNTNYQNYNNRADAYSRSRSTDPFGHEQRPASQAQATPKPEYKPPLTNCPGCGAEVGPNDTFCQMCGRRIK